MIVLLLFVEFSDVMLGRLLLFWSTYFFLMVIVFF